MEMNQMKEEKNIDDFFGNFEFNYAVVIFGQLSEIQKVKELIENQQGIKIRYQTLDRGKLLVKREGEG